MYDTDSDFIPKINAAYNIFSFIINYFLYELKILKSLLNYGNICNAIYYYEKKLRIGYCFLIFELFIKNFRYYYIIEFYIFLYAINNSLDQQSAKIKYEIKRDVNYNNNN